jgi:tetratricopeptide (TPR) repeat protein
MSEVKQVRHTTENDQVVDRARDFWSQYKKPILVIGGVAVLLIAGILGYNKFVKGPKEKKAAELVFKAHDYYMRDSARLSINGDQRHPGAAKLADQYDGTKAGNLAAYIAGVNYLKLEDYKNAEKYLKEFETSSRPVQARAYKLLADAYAAQGKNSDALNYYKKAGRHFEDDRMNSAEYLFLAGYFAQTVLKDREEAIDLYKEIKKKFPTAGPGIEADKQLAQLGVYSVE